MSKLYTVCNDLSGRHARLLLPGKIGASVGMVPVRYGYTVPHRAIF